LAPAAALAKLLCWWWRWPSMLLFYDCSKDECRMSSWLSFIMVWFWPWPPWTPKFLS